MWKILSSNEYNLWFAKLNERDKKAVLEKVYLLREFGPNLLRPHSDTIHGSKHKNLKELRIQTMQHILRIAYYFDPNRNAFLLTGGDKKGKNEKKFYKDLILESEIIIQKHEEELKYERCNTNNGEYDGSNFC